MKKLWIPMLIALLIIAAGGFAFYIFHQRLSGQGSGTSAEESGKITAEKERLEEQMTVQSVEVGEDDYGLPVLSASVELPDYSACFAEYMEEAVADTDQTDYEGFLENLLSLAGDACEAGKITTVTKEISVDLITEDNEKAKDDWTDEELQTLAKETALEEVLDEFAADILGDYLGNATNWDVDSDTQEGSSAGEVGQ